LKIAAAVVLAAAVAGCARDRARPGGRTLTDEVGRAVTLRGPVRRLISLAPSSTEIVFALGAGDRLVGLDKYSDWPPEARRIERVGSDIDPSLERIVALAPDLVLAATSANTSAIVDAIARLGVPVYCSRVDSLADVWRDMAAIGDAIDRREAAAALVEQLRARFAAIEKRAAARPRARAAVVVWTDPLVIAGRKSHVADLLAAAGGLNVLDDSDQSFPTYSVERLVARAPEVLIVGTHADQAPPLTPLERLTTLPAVRDRRLHELDGDLLFRPGPRLADGVEALLPLLHPELAK
jgi:iron complex transport system substrate-binding protein